MSTLSAIDINHDVEFLHQNHWIPLSYSLPFGGPPPLWGQGSAFPYRSSLAGGAGLLGPVGMGLGPSNGGLPSGTQNQAVLGLLQPMQRHPLVYKRRSSRRLQAREICIGYSARNQPSPSHAAWNINAKFDNGQRNTKCCQEVTNCRTTHILATAQQPTSVHCPCTEGPPHTVSTASSVE